MNSEEKFLQHYNSAPFALDRLRDAGRDTAKRIERESVSACEAGVPRKMVKRWERRAYALLWKVEREVERWKQRKKEKLYVLVANKT